MINQYNIHPRVGFLEALKLAYKRTCDFKGRSRRSEFWFFALFNFIISLLILIFMIVTIKKVTVENYYYRYTYYKINPFASILSSIQFLINVFPLISIQFRRLHDIGKSEAYWFLGFIPLAGIIILIVLYCRDSQPELNVYGPSPKYYLKEGNFLGNLHPSPNLSNEIELKVNPEQTSDVQLQQNVENPQNNQ